MILGVIAWSIFHPFDSALRYSLLWNVGRNGFWFVDIPRTSSSSRRTELASQFGPIYGQSNLLDEGLRRVSLPRHAWLKRLGIGGHSTAQPVRGVLGPWFWADIFTFSLVRNPWSTRLPPYFYLIKRGHISSMLSFRDDFGRSSSPRYGIQNSMHPRPA